MSDITLYEAMQYIDEYLTEKAPRGAYKKYVKTKYNNFMKELDENDRLKKAGLATDDDREKIWKKHDAEDTKLLLKHGISVDAGNCAIQQAHQNKFASKYPNHPVHQANLELVKNFKKHFGQDKENMKSDLEKRSAGHHAKESTKLNIYEAYDNGIITEDEKNEYLSLLESTSSVLIDTVKKEESKIKSEINKYLKKFFEEEKDKPGPAPFKYKGQDITPDNWRDTIKKAPTVGKIDYDGCDIPMIMLSYAGSKTSHDHILFFEEDFVKYLRKERDHNKVLNKYNFEYEDYPGIFITLKKK